MEKIILSDISNDINKLDVIENKEIFINKYKDIGEKINIIDNFLNSDNNDNNDNNRDKDNKEKTFTDIIEELINLNMAEINNNMTIEKLKYYSDLLKKYSHKNEKIDEYMNFIRNKCEKHICINKKLSKISVKKFKNL